MVVNHFTLPLTFIEQHLFIFAPHHHHRHVSYHQTNMVVIHSLISPTSGRVRRPTWGIKLHHHHHQPLHSPSHSDFINLYFDVHRPFCLHLHGHVFSTMLGFRLHSSISTARAGAHGSPSLPHHALVHRWDRTRHRLHFSAYARVLRSSPSSFRTLAISLSSADYHLPLLGLHKLTLAFYYNGPLIIAVQYIFLDLCLFYQ